MITPSLAHCSSASEASLSDPPSDDHRLVGVVTPHHLVSPAMRRLDDPYEFGRDPGSDDSNMSASPTKEHVARMSEMKGKNVARTFDTSPWRFPLSTFGPVNGR